MSKVCNLKTKNLKLRNSVMTPNRNFTLLIFTSICIIIVLSFEDFLMMTLILCVLALVVGWATGHYGINGIVDFVKAQIAKLKTPKE